jgi:hypothetical protein
MARRLLDPKITTMPSSFIAHWQLSRYGVNREQVCGLGQYRQPDETWPLPQHLRVKLGGLLQGLGFEPSREIWVCELPFQHVFRFTQRSRQEERDRDLERKPRLRWLDEVAR